MPKSEKTYNLGQAPRRQFVSGSLLPFSGGAILLILVSVWLPRPSKTAARTPIETSPFDFEEVSARAGLISINLNGGDESKRYIIESSGSGVALLDYDNDGLTDIFFVNGTRLTGLPSGPPPTNHLYRNQGNLKFVDVTESAGLARTGWGQGVCAGDYDNDGFEDLFVTYYGSNTLYRNTGKGSFQDVTRAAGLETGKRNWSTGCAFLDYDRDGWLDLFVANYVDFDLARAPEPGANPFCFWKGVPVFCGPRGLGGQSNHLYHNNHDGTFTDVSRQAGIQVPGEHYAFGVLTADFENRGLTDVYVACDSTASLLYRNKGDGTFDEVGVQAGVAYTEDGLGQAGMGVAAGDYDGDGFLDILKTNFSDDTPNLYRNNGDGTFSDRVFDAHLGNNVKYLGWGCGFVDFDNDGWKDIFMANGHVYPELEKHGLDTPYRERCLLYQNHGDGTFEDLSRVAGPGLQLMKSGRGVAFGDLDNDGDVDIVVNNQNDPPTLLLNQSRVKNNSISIRTIGLQSNRDGIGTRVTVAVGDHRQIEEVRSGGSYLSQNDLRVHFGLGKAARADRVEIRWPSGQVDRLVDVLANQLIVVREGKGVIRTEKFVR